MARARVCDRCNKTITGNGEYYAFDVYRYGIKNCSKARCLDLEYELCNECMNDFEDFIKKGSSRKQENERKEFQRDC